jgi:nucleoside-diphosphate-sugar epimerase
MLKLALEKQASFLLASTSEVYGSAKEHPQPEEYWGNVNPNGPRSCYDESKRFAESFTINFGRRYRVPYAIVRIFNTYGPHMRANDGRVVSNFVVQALAGKELTIYGKGTHTRCFCYVDDLVEGVSRAAELRHPEPINLGSAHEITIRALAEMVLRLTGGTGRLVFQPLPVDDPHVRQPKLERANRLLGWQPTIPLEEGLRRTIAFFRGKKPPL